MTALNPEIAVEKGPVRDADGEMAGAERAAAVSARGGRSDRTLPILLTESSRERRAWVCVMLLAAALYAMLIFGFWAPADGGVDQNAYLVGGRMIAEHGTPKLQMANPFEYVGAMFIRTPSGAYYPKYPFGLPLLYAMVFWIFGAAKANVLVFAVSPLSAIAAFIGMFYLARTVTGSFAALMSAILLGTSQLTLMLANNPNSHASCLACGVWGMFFLLRWWQSGTWWRGVLAGFLLGYACLIRYSEGLLILPIAVAVLHRLRWSDWRSWLRNSVPVLAWLVPVATLAIFNKVAMGYWTGYDSTRESEFGAAFTLAKISTTWELMLRTMYDTGLFFTLPLGIAGLGMMFRKNWALGLAMVLWFVPGVALYTSYYFSPEMGLAYARFFLTFLPPALVGVAVCFNDGMLGSWLGGRRLRSGVVAAGVVTIIASSVGCYRALAGMESGRSGAEGMLEEYIGRQNLAVTGSILAKNVPAGSTVFMGGGGGVRSGTNYLQFMGDWHVFTTTAFTGRGLRGGMGGRFGADNNGPTPRQEEQTEYEQALYAKYSPYQLEEEQAKVINEALLSGKRVFVIAPPAEVGNFRENLRGGSRYAFVTVARWKDYVDAEDEDTAANQGQGRFGGGARGGGGGRGVRQNFGGGGGPGFGGPAGGFGGPPGGFGGPGLGGRGGRAAGPMGGPGEIASDWQLLEIKLAAGK